jgi:hypothetical protein
MDCRPQLQGAEQKSSFTGNNNTMHKIHLAHLFNPPSRLVSVWILFECILQAEEECSTTDLNSTNAATQICGKFDRKSCWWWLEDSLIWWIADTMTAAANPASNPLRTGNNNTHAKILCSSLQPWLVSVLLSQFLFLNALPKLKNAQRISVPPMHKLQQLQKLRTLSRTGNNHTPMQNFMFLFPTNHD